MLFFYGLILCLYVNYSCGGSKASMINSGTTLFNRKINTSHCWTPQELAILRARKAFDSIIPSPVTPIECNNRYVKHLLAYFKICLAQAENNPNPFVNRILREALVDALGSHLQCDILPTIRYSFYAGYLPYKKARQIHIFQENLKKELNTQGIGWKKPDKLPKWSNLTVTKFLLNSAKFVDPCSSLVFKRDSNSCIHLPTPLLDDREEPHAIALPFKEGGLYNLESEKSNGILLKYYAKGARCILHSSPPSCKHKDFVTFNNEMWHWMKREIAPHLADEKLYAAFGGVLRIAAAVQNYGKGLQRRNLFSTPSSIAKRWHPWKVISDPYMELETDWTPHIYAGVAFAAVIAICVTQICCFQLLRSNCRSRNQQLPSQSSAGKQQNVIASATVVGNQPVVSRAYHHPQNNNNSIGVSHVSSSQEKTRTSSVSVRTTKVYDLNENNEKVMTIITSDNDESSSEEETPRRKRTCTEEETDVRSLMTSYSPPKIDTSISQVHVSKTITKSAPYSTSSLSRSEATYKEQPITDSMWSGSASVTYSSSHTESSTGSQTRSRKSRSSRDMSWARRVMSKHSNKDTLTKSSTGTGFDYNSLSTVTPLSRNYRK